MLFYDEFRLFLLLCSNIHQVVLLLRHRILHSDSLKHTLWLCIGLYLFDSANRYDVRIGNLSWLWPFLILSLLDLIEERMRDHDIWIVKLIQVLWEVRLMSLIMLYSILSLLSFFLDVLTLTAIFISNATASFLTTQGGISCSLIREWTYILAMDYWSGSLDWLDNYSLWPCSWIRFWRACSLYLSCLSLIHISNTTLSAKVNRSAT